MDGENDESDAPKKKPVPATIENCDRWRGKGKRRYKPFDWPGMGLVGLQSAMAREFIRIDAARTRARMAAVSGRIKDHEQATIEYFLLVCFLLVVKVNDDGQPLPGQMFFDADDPEHKKILLDMDNAIVDPLAAEAMDFCNIASIDLEEAEKK